MCKCFCLYLRRLALAFASASCPLLRSSANSNQDTFAYAIDVRVSLTHNIWLAPLGPRRATNFERNVSERARKDAKNKQWNEKKWEEKYKKFVYVSKIILKIAQLVFGGKFISWHISSVAQSRFSFELLKFCSIFSLFFILS